MSCTNNRRIDKYQENDDHTHVIQICISHNMNEIYSEDKDNQCNVKYKVILTQVIMRKIMWKIIHYFSNFNKSNHLVKEYFNNLWVYYCNVNNLFSLIKREHSMNDKHEMNHHIYMRHHDGTSKIYYTNTKHYECVNPFHLWFRDVVNCNCIILKTRIQLYNFNYTITDESHECEIIHSYLILNERETFEIKHSNVDSESLFFNKCSLLIVFWCRIMINSIVNILHFRLTFADNEHKLCGHTLIYTYNLLFKIKIKHDHLNSIDFKCYMFYSFSVPNEKLEIPIYGEFRCNLKFNFIIN